MAVRFLQKASVWLKKRRITLLAVSCMGLFGANLSYHVFPDQTFKLLHECWSEGQPAELSQRLCGVFQDVLQDTGVKSADSYRAFAVSGFHPVSAGIPWFPAGSLVGIPPNFESTAENKKGIVNHVVVISGKEVDWESNEGVALKEALTFSLEAQKFALAREVMYLQNSSPLASAAVAPTCLAGTFFCGRAIKLLLGFSSGPVILRGICNLITAAAGLMCYYVSYDAVTYHLDCKADRRAATVSKDYARGGVEFYDKILSRNRIFRGLMGKQGMKIYAPSGNLFPRHWFRIKYTPYTYRRDLIVNILRELQA
ncbi:transmembrane protein 177 [Pezoporus wallicus]|uniref:transmembrane protein 177 n=1 Tax=Pezoporus wallicus TaxID=35540 RepID=UPI00254D60DE|nr:transmembrane protein 177 [Pezoporus wallicus]XP_057286342.1 transmembrane protein 177 [Pezoporus wallicus]XP_057286344.1 transmembrane protein 177 [Pezoporus wallicus]XP_057286345.1 transmembrane protein 177 [Pezoporus wallicus]XP_061319177.1 transmembrane protein 177 [Pezoporus flaviventris]XP_061319267.1 transmembrane protein 177 [Pezoporus flaviventris]XP_061319357.1 transmembrane protein 177 [Pezoporus flaviventris]XP_061319437.1 transmembrane protein 177 [Pezoporus flaviventris]